ncbi:GNAT family N-acetyltransferase [Dactylosporangium sp. CA-139066]|uniref:GNAT family N-acetyltransferase n=1 Tax=Dactylosporangium sp. CA-139066 TaxID=3239930 RepID=UPI003D8C4255
MEVRPLSPDEWQLKRELRLAALKDSPDAFASTYARESHRSETDWRTWPPGGAFFTAFSDATAPGLGDASAPGFGFGSAPGLGAGSAPGLGAGSAPGLGAGSASGFAPASGEPLGIAGTWVAAAEPRTTHLISMWVAPVARGRGVAALLIDAVVGWARDHGHDTVELEVARGNTPAMSAYLRCGFIATDREPFTTGGTVLVRPVK